MSVKCSICGEAATQRVIKVRSGKEMPLWRCRPCDFDFFAHDPTKDLAANKLDESRLKAAGLDIPARDRDFANGLQQSKPHMAEYFEPRDRGGNVLEIGCSWGYFLQLVREAGGNPYGVELNTLRAAYVNDELRIPCDTSLDACEARNVRFRKICLFYVLEYVPEPVAYLQRLANLLEPGGAIVIVTPNLNDALRDLWRNEGFRKFFYDEHAINYMSARTVERMFARVTGIEADIVTRQGYSFVNHVSWHLTQAPRTTGIVGGDRFVSDIMGQLRPDASFNEWDARQRALAARLADLLTSFDVEYRRTLEEAKYGNQIRIVARK
jgi:2-polyprenyl-3-methyl-5-hydroxy-6-metoxy-1,4-benzoquinol methylase